MPSFDVNFTVHKDHLQGQITVEAANAEDAADRVRDMDIDALLEHTSDVDWSVDAWVPDK
jgi:hypothetical protein